MNVNDQRESSFNYIIRIYFLSSSPCWLPIGCQLCMCRSWRPITGEDLFNEHTCFTSTLRDFKLFVGLEIDNVCVVTHIVTDPRHRKPRRFVIPVLLIWRKKLFEVFPRTRLEKLHPSSVDLKFPMLVLLSNSTVLSFSPNPPSGNSKLAHLSFCSLSSPVLQPPDGYSINLSIFHSKWCYLGWGEGYIWILSFW